MGSARVRLYRRGAHLAVLGQGGAAWYCTAAQNVFSTTATFMVDWLEQVSQSTNSSLKGTVSRDFLLLVLFMNQFPPSPECTFRAVSNFFENSRRY
jgi:hypothetical protein